MDKRIKYLAIPIALSLFSCNNENNIDNEIINSINKTIDYLNEYELDNCLFSNILQMKLDNSLVYNIDSNEYLIIYNDLFYNYSNNKLNKIDNNEYSIVNSYNDIDYSSNKVLTKGYYNEYDGGNGYYLVNNDIELKSFNSTINVLQMGYKNNESLDIYINRFNELDYNNIFIPKGEYKVLDNFDINVSNKGYYGYDTLIYSDDSYNPKGFNNGCLFNIYNNISNISIFGFDVKPIISKKLDDPLLGLMTLKDVDGVIMNNCSFYLGNEASIYSSSGMIDLFTNWKNVIVKNCKLENYSSTLAGGGIGVRDIYKKGCSNASFINNYIYSNCKDEVIAVFSGGDTSLYPNETGGGYIKDVTFKGNKIIGGKPNSNLGPRVVGLTIGYQLSPVYNINYIDNDIEMYSANYLVLYGKANEVNFRNNNVRIDSSYMDDLYIMFIHNSYADEAFDIKILNNKFEFINNSNLYTISRGGLELEFSNNIINGNKITRVFDSISIFNNNVINMNEVSKCVYHDIRNTSNNIVNAEYINVIYEFYNINALEDILIYNDKINVNELGANMLMFNGSISFNNHSLTFNNFILDVKSINSKYYYLAYDTNSINDSLVINFINSNLSLYNDSKHNYIAKDNDNKVILNFINES